MTGKKGKSKLPFILGGVGGVGVAAVLLLKPKPAETTSLEFDIPDPGAP